MLSPTILISSSNDYIRYTLERLLIDTPGSRFNYNSGCTIILGEILYQATEEHSDALAARQIFTPLGITDYDWRYIIVNEMPHAANGLSLRPRDMAKFGQLFLDAGKWDGEQIVPQSWVQQATRAKIAVNAFTAYGFQWWIIHYDEQQLNLCIGYAGQYIIVAPEYNLVVVLTGGNADNGTDFTDIIFNYILPAIEG